MQGGGLGTSEGLGDGSAGAGAPVGLVALGVIGGLLLTGIGGGLVLGLVADSRAAVFAGLGCVVAGAIAGLAGFWVLMLITRTVWSFGLIAGQLVRAGVAVVLGLVVQIGVSPEPVVAFWGVLIGGMLLVLVGEVVSACFVISRERERATLSGAGSMMGVSGAGASVSGEIGGRVGSPEGTEVTA